MSGRPWWASDGPGDDGATGDPVDGDGPSSGRGRAAKDVPPHQHGTDVPHDVCQVCPICAVLRAVDDVRPELVEHLSEAARHLTLAAKAFIDAQASGYEPQDGGLQHIDLDE